MKKVFLICAFMAGAFFSNAQTFKPFKVDLATGYAVPSGKGSKGGIVLAIEPKYAINDNISLGLRMEAAITARGYVASNGQEVSGDVKASGSYLATGDYYFNTNKFRPFVGMGVGLFKNAAVAFDTGTAEANEVAAS